jgi:DNA-binding transcriptional ArsR family regulator
MGMNSVLDASALRRAADAASQLLKTLSHPDRLVLLCHLTDGEQCVSDLETASGIAQPSLSQQLGVLRQQGLVATRREGKNIYYSIDSPQAVAVMATLYAQFCDPKAKGKKR